MTYHANYKYKKAGVGVGRGPRGGGKIKERKKAGGTRVILENVKYKTHKKCNRLQRETFDNDKQDNPSGTHKNPHCA